MKLKGPLIAGAVAAPSVAVIGTIGYRWIENWSWADSAYMSVITVFTVGFGEIRPLTSGGRLFTAILIFTGLGAITFALTTLTDYLLAGEISGYLRGKMIQKQLKALTGHFVVCGFGEVGRQVCQELTRQHQQVLVIDSKPAALDRARAEGYAAMLGDAGLDSILIEANIARAAGLIVATNVDATNLLVVLSAKVLRSDLPIVARANIEEVSDKLLRAGADRVLFPQGIAGRRMANMVINPDVCDFVDVMTQDRSLELLIESVQVKAHSPLANQRLESITLRELTGATVIGLKRPGANIYFAPESGTPIQADDVLFVLGTQQQVLKVAALNAVK